MKNTILVLAFMITGLSSAQDFSSFSVTETVKHHKDVKDGVWTQTLDQIVYQLTSSDNTIDDFNALINITLEILEDNRNDLCEWGDDTVDDYINEVKNRYIDEFENLFELTKRGGGITRSYKITGSVSTVNIHLMLLRDNYSIRIPSIFIQ